MNARQRRIFDEAPGPSPSAIAATNHGPECVNCGGVYSVTKNRDGRLWCSFCGGWADVKRHAW